MFSGCMLIPTNWNETTSIKNLAFPVAVAASDIALVLKPAIPYGRETRGAIEQAVTGWLLDLSTANSQAVKSETISTLLLEAPKRWSVYRPMVLLPNGSFETLAWQNLLSSLEDSDKANLWSTILYFISIKDGTDALTHLAVNSGIPFSEDTGTGQENILRSPSVLKILHGDFGPSLSSAANPTAQDFDDAFWVRTKQNGILQIWAPRYTMFSRGNIKEKARLLAFHETSADKDSINVHKSSAVDLYAGIGYFVFSYARLGLRVWCWEINPWSVEGLRRGAIENGWSIKVVKGEEKRMETAYYYDEQIVVFEEGNEFAAERIQKLRSLENADGIGEVRHVNCGFLPSSEPSWNTALCILDERKGGWLHLHENVAVGDIARRKHEVEETVKIWDKTPGVRHISVQHVEQVKTFAPGVWHCVFDVHVEPKTNS